MKKKVQMKKMAGVFLALAILGIGLFPPGNVYAAANQAPDADPVVVVLDPGHGGHDQGARYKWGGKTYKEKQLNLAIAKACKTELEKYAGVKVYMTRSSDRFVTLGNRVNFAKSRKADLFVAIHNNASLKKTDHGACVYYPNSGYKEEVGSEGKMAAASIQKQLVALGLKNNGILYRNSAVGSRYPDKSKADYYAVIKRSKYAGFPGLIVEHAYVSNHDDSTTFLNGNDRLKRLGVADATGIAYGIVDPCRGTRYITGIHPRENKALTASALQMHLFAADKPVFKIKPAFLLCLKFKIILQTLVLRTHGCGPPDLIF